MLVSFPFLFVPAIGLHVNKDPNEMDVKSSKQEIMTVYYSAFVVLFQFGWATVQISHLSMIPDITSCENARMNLTSVRYAATVISSIFVYSFTWILLDTGKVPVLLVRAPG